MSATPNIIIPGKHDRERRVFQATLTGFDGAAAVTSVLMVMDEVAVGGSGTVNPGMPVAAKGTHIFTTWAVTADTVPGDWAMTLHRNEGAALSSFPLVVGASNLQVINFGVWAPEVYYDAGDTWHIIASGPQKNFVLIRAVLRFEEIS